MRPVRAIAFLIILGLLNGCSDLSITIREGGRSEESSNCDISVSDFKVVEKMYEKEYRYYGLKAGDTVADIGAGNLFLALANMCFTDDLTFYVQDINMKCLTEKHVQREKVHFARLRGKGPLKGNLYLVQGDTNRSNLPFNTFDKVILRLVYHEFKHPEQNLQDIYQILKPDGRLMVYERISKKENKPIECGVRRTHENLIQEFQKAGFVLEDWMKISSAVRIYRFKKSNGHLEN